MSLIFPPWDTEASEPAQLELIAAFIKCSKPDIVVEAGTYRGHGAVILGDALRQNGKGKMFTADPYDSGQGLIIDHNDLGEWVTYYKGDFLEMLAGIPHVDIAYIDASGRPNHDASLRILHLEAVKAKLAPGGTIFVDDTKGDWAPWNDGEGGASRDRIRAQCVNFEWLRGMSMYVVRCPFCGAAEDPCYCMADE